jgi:ABC-type branched-subunit amino acid transport system substrate-binding protein
MQILPVDSPIVSKPSERTGAAVAVAGINASGGVAGGRPLQLDFCDDKLTPTLAAQCVQQLIANGDVASVSGDGGTGNTIQPLLQANDIASFAGNPVSSADVTSPVAFPLVGGTYNALGFGPLMKMKFPNAKSVVLLMSDAAGRDLRASLLAQGARNVGLSVGDTVVIPANTADLSSIAGQISRLKPDIILASLVPPDLIKYWSASRSLGVTIPFATTASGVTPEILAQAGTATSYSNFVDVVPPYQSNAAGAAQFRTQMAKYAKGQALSRDAWIGWIQVTTFASIIKSMRGTINNRTVLGTIRGVKCFTVLFYKCLNFTKPGPIPGAPVIRVNNTFLLEPNGTQLVGTKYAYNALS